jgi:phage terminase large subunit-like protein
VITAQTLRELPDSEVASVLQQLGPKKTEELRHDWNFWARPEQLEPEGKWNVWVALAGRGWGKTRAGAEWVRHRIKTQVYSMSVGRVIRHIGESILDFLLGRLPTIL